MKRLFWTVYLLFTLIPLASPGFAADRFVPWEEGVFDHVQQQYGPQAAERLRSVHDLILQYQDAPVETKLRVVNETLNGLPWLTDRAKWSKEDYWATPFETLTTFGGDCEDMAIGKFVMLRAMGVPKDRLSLAYTKLKKTGESHMVLLYGKIGEEPPLVLDNFVTEIKPAPQRTDLVGVMVFDADGKFWLIKDDGRKRTVASEVSGKRLSKLETVKARILETRATMREYNGGRPLIPGGP
jgi:predicted transglutaminase-like cysteine proteinase